MGMEIAKSKPPRCVLVNVTTGNRMECLFNPSQLTEKLQANYNHLAVPGLSYQPLQYQSTANRQLTGVEFYLDRFFAAEQPGSPDILAFRKFLKELTVPPAGAAGVRLGAPPRVLFLWPNVLTIESVVTELEFQYRQFGLDGSVLIYTATCTFEEIVDLRVANSDLEEEGF